MNIINWNKISSKDKDKLRKIQDLTFVSGPINLSTKRIKQIEKMYLNLLFGCLKDKEITGLEGSIQFKPLKEKPLVSSLKKKDSIIIKHFHKDVRYIIKEVQPSRVVFINGSWKGPIHYRSEYWKAIDIGAEIQLRSPFINDHEAKEYERKVKRSQSRRKKLYKKNRKYSDEEIMRLTYELAKNSWDWIGQIGAVLARKGKILLTAWNRVVPYEAYQMHKGSPREAKQIPSQEMLETQLTNHAECEILEFARRENVNLKGATLYVSLFPCPICAKILSRTDIEQIIYSHDHNINNDIGYKVLQLSGKKIKRIVPD